MQLSLEDLIKLQEAQALTAGIAEGAEQASNEYLTQLADEAREALSKLLVIAGDHVLVERS